MEDEAQLCSSIWSMSDVLLVRRAARHCGEKRRALSVAQRRLRCSVHLIHLLSALLRCDGFARIQTPANPSQVQSVRQADHQTVTRTFFLVPVWLWEVFWSFFLVQILSWSSLVSCIKSTFHGKPKSNQEMVTCCCTE